MLISTLQCRAAEERPVFIYVCGPYKASNEERLELNVQRANEAGLQVAKKGHFPFIPHTMMKGWEDGGKISREEVIRICLAWLERTDGVLFLGSSFAANLELAHARELGLRVFHDVSEIPEVERPR